MEGIEIVRIDQGRAGEYHAQQGANTHLGRLTWVARDSGDTAVRVANHTLVPREQEGRGIATALVAALIEDARAQGFKVEPACSFVAAQFRLHPEWAGLRA